VLDIGTGSGTIAAHFSQIVDSLISVDVVDERVDTSFDFRLVESESLPFEDESFDVAISNHVIEHVLKPQLHLREIERVLRPGGACYLATPNRLWPMEPHFHLPFLAWLPSRHLQDFYVRTTGRGRQYDAQLITLAVLRRMARQAGLVCQDISFDMARIILREKSGRDLSPAKPLWTLFGSLSPSLVSLLWRTRDA
jgi:ubiquinone/menaquinone biosynthesis C-methylase UbiE